MKRFEDLFDPFDPNHLNELFRARATGKPPNFGVEYGVIGWLPQNWQEIADGKIIEAFCQIIERSGQQEQAVSTGVVDITSLMCYDINTLLKGAINPAATSLQEVYYKILGASIKLKQFLVETEAYAKIQENLQ
jgi:hypothetical protein